MTGSILQFLAFWAFISLHPNPISKILHTHSKLQYRRSRPFDMHTALPAFRHDTRAGDGQPLPSGWEDAAEVSHASAPVLHREGLLRRAPTD